MLWIRSRETGMNNENRLKDPCQAKTARINEPWKRGAIDYRSVFFIESIAESHKDPKSGDRYE